MRTRWLRSNCAQLLRVEMAKFVVMKRRLEGRVEYKLCSSTVSELRHWPASQQALALLETQNGPQLAEKSAVHNTVRIECTLSV